MDTDKHHRLLHRSTTGQRRTLFLLAVVLLGIVTIFAFTRGSNVPGKATPAAPPAVEPALAADGTYRLYPFPRTDSQVMRPAIDHEGRVWFGDMTQNALVVFDPRTKTYRYLVPPQGHHGIMGVLVAPDDTIWFAEQFANYIGRYYPTTGRYQLYFLPRVAMLASGQMGQLQSLSSAPNELVLDRQGEVWFTEFNADRLGRLDPRTGRIRQYALSPKTSVETLYPYGVTIDAQGMVWFTESGTNQLGRLDPQTGALRLFSAPDPGAMLMEIASDARGGIWMTTFTPGLLYHLAPDTGIFTSYQAPLSGKESSALYGLLVTTSGDVWVTILSENVLARLDVSAHRFVYYHISRPNSQPLGLAIDSKNALWFTGVDAVGVMIP